MGFWSKWFGSGRGRVPEEELEALIRSTAILDRRRLRERADEVSSEAGAKAERDELDTAAISYNSLITAVEPCFSALERYPLDDAVLRVVARALTFSGDPDTAEACLRAADAHHDVRVWFELGARLLAMERPETAIVMLSHALSLSPFNPVIRSELAIAETRAGRPQDAVATLALHPNLTGDPGALFTFGWASLLSGDMLSAAGALEELSRLSRGPLVDKLEAALGRARGLRGEDAEQVHWASARDFLFLEYGCVLLEESEEKGGRFHRSDFDSKRLSDLVNSIGWAASELLGTVAVVCPADADSMGLATALSGALRAEVRPLTELPPPSGLVVARDGAALEKAKDRLQKGNRSLLTAALWMDWSRPLSLVPDLVGILSRDVSLPTVALSEDTLLGFSSLIREPSPELEAFIREQRGHLPPRGRRVIGAYVPDAPLPPA